MCWVEVLARVPLSIPHVAMAVANNGNNGVSAGGLDGIELEALTRQQLQLNDGTGSLAGAVGGAGASSLAGGSGGGGTPKPKRAAVTKKLQFSTPEFSVTPIPAVSVAGGSRLMPSRKR